MYRYTGGPLASVKAQQVTIYSVPVYCTMTSLVSGNRGGNQLVTGNFTGTVYRTAPTVTKDALYTGHGAEVSRL